MGKKTFARLSTTLALALAVALLLEVCPGFAEQTDSATPSPALQKMGVLPFFKGSSGYSPTESLVCPVCQLIYDPETLSPDCDKVLTQYVQEALEKKLGARVLPQAVVARSYEQMPRDELRDTALTLSQRIGKLLGADFMAVGSVWKYRERVGGARAVSSPASVAFALHLVDVQNGTVVWSKSFVQTQRSLSENLLEAKAFFDQGAKWLTADELASYGVKEILKEFPH
jgi:curli biogenesis system outer membrane secretion channel CsgG